MKRSNISFITYHSNFTHFSFFIFSALLLHLFLLLFSFFFFFFSLGFFFFNLLSLCDRIRSQRRRCKMMPPGLVSNLQEVLLSRKGESNSNANAEEEKSTETVEPVEFDESKPTVLVTNSDGVDSPGLTHLVQALVQQGLYNVHVCVPQSWVCNVNWMHFSTTFSASLFVILYFVKPLRRDKSASGHSVTLRETVEAASAKVSGATGFEISGIV